MYQWLAGTLIHQAKKVQIQGLAMVFQQWTAIWVCIGLLLLEALVCLAYSDKMFYIFV